MNQGRSDDGPYDPDAIVARREACAVFTAPKVSLSRRALLLVACATVFIALRMVSPPVRQSGGPKHSAHIAATGPVEESWRGFSRARRERLSLINQWIVDRYDAGAYSEVGGVVMDLMGSVGNHEIKDYANTYVNFSSRWELARFLLPALDPLRSDENVRRSTLRVIYLAASGSGTRYLGSVERSIVQDYMQSMVETDSTALVWGEKALREMIRLGL